MKKHETRLIVSTITERHKEDLEEEGARWEGRGRGLKKKKEPSCNTCIHSPSKLHILQMYPN